MATYYLNGASREGSSESNKLSYVVPKGKQWATEDKKWMTLEQAERGWGIFQLSVDGPPVRTQRVVLGGSDKIARVNGNDIVVVAHNANEAKTAPSLRATLAPG